MTTNKLEKSIRWIMSKINVAKRTFEKYIEKLETNDVLKRTSNKVYK